MATNSKSILSDYTQLNTLPAVTGVLFAVASSVQFLGATVSLSTPAYTFDPAHAMLVSLLMLVVAFASSETKDWRHYDEWEQGVVGVAAITLVGTEYVPEIADLVMSSQGTQVGAFVLSLAAWGVLSR